MSFIRRVIAVCAVAVMVAGVGQVPASAGVQWAQDLITPDGPMCAENSTGTAIVACVYGAIAWGNRTAEIQGEVSDHGPGDLYVDKAVVYFDAFAGSTKVTSTTRTSFTGNGTPFHFTIGDPNLVGGINRIRTQVCLDRTSDGVHIACSTQWNSIRD